MALATNLQPTARGLRMPDHISDRLTQHQAKHRLLVRRQHHRFQVRGQLHTGGRKRTPSLGDLCGQTLSAVAGHRLPHLGQRLARSGLHLGDLAVCQCRVGHK